MTEISEDYRRPQIHFTPLRNWMNDPCGLVYHKGIFHLYYQHNPHENLWGPMHWGHAVSSDLFHWEDREIALYPHEEYGMAFTGSAVVEKGVFPGSTFVALYTGAVPKESIRKNHQQQCLATSPDGSRWTPHRVVIPNPGITDFRDPAIGRHPDTGRWIMAVAAGDEIWFYSASDLREWRYESSFGRGMGFTADEWECPDIFPLEVADTSSPPVRKWVLIVHAGRGHSERQAGAQYIVGEFDGKRFIPEMPDFLPVDHGHDFYAAQTWRNTGNRTIWIAWAAHAAYCDAPTTPTWSGILTLPRELSLIRTDSDGFCLQQQPVHEIESLPKTQITAEDQRTRDGIRHYRFRARSTGAYRIAIDSPGGAPRVGGGEWSIHLVFGDSGLIGLEKTVDRLTVDRSRLAMGYLGGVADLLKTVDLVKRADPIESSGHADQVFVDGSILEVFLDGGSVATTDLIAPPSPITEIVLIASTDSTVAVERIEPTVRMSL